MRAGDEGCKACKGGSVPCKGGGNINCWRRNPCAAHIALILDTYGGSRVIVADLDSLNANMLDDELAHVVPDLLVHEPIAWNDIPIVIERARVEFEKWLETRPNLDEGHSRSVALYRLRALENPQRSLDLAAIVET